MNIYECKIPQIDVNDKRIVVNDFRFNDGSYVNQKETILSLETAKAISEFYTEASGYIAYAVEEGDELTIGDIVAVIFDNELDAKEYAKKLKETRELQRKDYKATVKAEKLAMELGVDLEQIKKDGIIKEADVREFYNKRMASQ
mgnify:CR=1 FL=1|jgi:pyruvate/2-oxoglutarate dehydrogenase complex dihydrolipoamide acyltransferase (E2) component